MSTKGRGTYFTNDGPLDSPGLLAPTIWWPEDRSWFVASDADFGWTYVAGATPLIDAVESSPRLEALRTDYHRSHTIDADMLNEP